MTGSNDCNAALHAADEPGSVDWATRELLPPGGTTTAPAASWCLDSRVVLEEVLLCCCLREVELLLGCWECFSEAPPWRLL